MAWRFYSPVDEINPIIHDFTVVTGVAADYTISGIPATFSELILDLYARSHSGAAVADSVSVRFNSDTGANYDNQFMSVNNATVTGLIESAATSARWGMAVGSSGTANAFGASTLRIPNYSNAVAWKAFDFVAHADGGGTTSAFARTGGGRWKSTAAISSITIIIGAGGLGLAQYSRVLLRGVGVT